MPDPKRRSALLAAATLLLLPACGHSSRTTGSGGTDTGVATLQSSGAASAKPGTPDDERPLIRPDTTDQEYVALNNAWLRCLGDHGVPLRPPQGPDGIIKSTADLTDPKYRAAADACAAKKPETWQDRDARTDPRYADHIREEARCLEAQGIKVEITGNPPGISFTDDRQVSRALTLAPDCERQAFRDQIKAYSDK